MIEKAPDQTLIDLAQHVGVRFEHASSWTDQEIGFAMGRGVPIFSVRFGADPYGFIGRFQAFDGSGKEAAGLARELFNAYRKHKQTQHRMADVLVGLFEESGSFDEAKERVRHLEELKVWDASFPGRIRSALKNNSQISAAWTVPTYVEALARKWTTTAP